MFLIKIFLEASEAMKGSCIIPGWSAPRQVIHDKYEINATCEKNLTHNFRGEDV